MLSDFKVGAAAPSHCIASLTGSPALTYWSPGPVSDIYKTNKLSGLAENGI